MAEQNSSDKHFELAVELSRDALKALLFVNGGAAAALIALMEKTNGAHDFTIPILWFGLGTVGAVISTCSAYFSQLQYANSVQTSGHPVTITASYEYLRNHTRWQRRIFVVVVATLIFMVVGIFTAARIANSSSETAKVVAQARTDSATATSTQNYHRDVNSVSRNGAIPVVSIYCPPPEAPRASTSPQGGGN